MRMRRWDIWHRPIFLLVLAAGFAAAAQSLPKTEGKTGANLLHPRNFSEALVRSQVLTELGQSLFSEKALSGSGQMSCASCHDPDHAFTPGNDLAVQLGGEKLDQPGNRAVPTLKYLQASHPFELHHKAGEEDGGNENVDQGPAGGLTW